MGSASSSGPGTPHADESTPLSERHNVFQPGCLWIRQLLPAHPSHFCGLCCNRLKHNQTGMVSEAILIPASVMAYEDLEIALKTAFRACICSKVQIARRCRGRVASIHPCTWPLFQHLLNSGAEIELSCDFICSHIDLLPEAPCPLDPTQYLNVHVFALRRDGRDTSATEEARVNMTINARTDMSAARKFILDRLDLPPGAAPRLFLRGADIMQLSLEGIECWRALTREEIGKRPLVLALFCSLN
ncbi:MAG: hypothetical protein M1839_003769 [Geoglossum umbratile]|nr:MAG: hypothetical protein M1839_003769 [Geoglossum umbratile]